MDNSKQTDASQALKFYAELVRFALDSGSAPGLQARRDDLGQAVLDANQTEKLAQLDEEVIADVMDLPSIDDDLIQDNSQPLHYWWWHLGKIREGSYPADLLPSHLSVIYSQEADSGKKAA